MFQILDVLLWRRQHNPAKLEQFVARMYSFLVAANARVGPNGKRVTGGDQPANRALCAGRRVHMAIAAFQPGVGMGAMSERIAHLFMTIRAQRRDRICHWGLAVRIVASLALNAGILMRACPPLVSCGFMAGTAQLCVGCARHRFSWMPWLKRTMTGFASHTNFRISAIL